MSSPPFGKHASGATNSQAAVPEPSFAERARTLMHSGRIGSLDHIAKTAWLSLRILDALRAG